MKISKLVKRPLAIAALVVLLVFGSGGTALLGSGQAAAATAAPSKKYGYMVIYGEQGRFNSVKISAADLSKTVHCGGVINASHTANIRKIPAPKAGVTQRLKFKCTAIGGVSQYIVYFGKDKKFGVPPYVSVDIDGGYCTLVHANPALTRKVPVQAGGKCATDTDTPTKLDVAMRVLPAITASKQAIKGYVELKASESLTRAQCTGQVDITMARGDDSHTFSRPLKYTRTKDTKVGYCAAVLNRLGTNVRGFLKRGSTFTITANYGGSPYLNPGSASATIQLPPKK